MGNSMRPISFSSMLFELMEEYRSNHSFYGVIVEHNWEVAPIGPAAGPHTQMAGNLIAAYAAGATYFELKTIQILQGEELQIKKPCIYVGHEVYNIEWSTELTIEQARDEYCKAYLLIQILSKEFGLRGVEHLHFIMSIGYDLKGIQSPSVDAFITTMGKAGMTTQWQENIQYLRENSEQFQQITLDEIEQINTQDMVSNTVTLSTMHGCKSSEIQRIACYLLQEKGLHTYIKMNPTLVGKDCIRLLLDRKGYTEIECAENIFQNDITLPMAKAIIETCKEVASHCGKRFGVKVTNTLPIKTKHGELQGEEMYMSGPALYPISLQVLYELALMLEGKLELSYSGGVVEHNIRELLELGLSSVTVSSYLLKPEGYKNLKKLMKRSQGYHKKEGLDTQAICALKEQVILDPLYNKKSAVTFERKEGYSEYCAKCKNCVDVCPNRANVRKKNAVGAPIVIHRERLCNECGCCAYWCIMGHVPYLEKYTVYE